MPKNKQGIQSTLRDEIKSACEYRPFEKCDYSCRISNEICSKKLEHVLAQLDAMKQAIDQYHDAMWRSRRRCNCFYKFQQVIWLCGADYFWSRTFFLEIARGHWIPNFDIRSSSIFLIGLRLKVTSCSIFLTLCLFHYNTKLNFIFCIFSSNSILELEWISIMKWCKTWLCGIQLNFKFEVILYQTVEFYWICVSS